jgi:hypothetical protein
VKFAKTVPTAEDGELVLVRAEHIVRETLPNVTPALPDPPAPPCARLPIIHFPLPLPPRIRSRPRSTPTPSPEPDAEAAKWGPKPTPKAPESKP